MEAGSSLIHHMHDDLETAVSAPSTLHAQLAQIIHYQAAALSGFADAIPGELVELARYLVASKGRVFFSGTGKSGHIARKVAATFASTGTSAFYMHPTEALHGDMGVIHQGDLFIGLSKSGISAEFSALFPLLRSQGIALGLLTSAQTLLSRLVNFCVVIGCPPEAGHVAQVPTTSSMLMLAACDALALVVSKLKGFTERDFARVHPGGAIGTALNLKVDDIMHQGSGLPLLFATDSFMQIMNVITEKKLGAGIVVDEQRRVRGIITDGDLRRACGRGPDVFNATAHDIMTTFPKTIAVGSYAHVAATLMQSHAITSLIVTRAEQVVGLLHIHDLLARGIGA